MPKVYETNRVIVTKYMFNEPFIWEKIPKIFHSFENGCFYIFIQALNWSICGLNIYIFGIFFWLFANELPLLKP